jgi:hypothetical protein
MAAARVHVLIDIFFFLTEYSVFYTLYELKNSSL